MSDYAVSSMTLHDALLIDATLLDFISLETETQTQTLKDMFIARWDIYEIGGETIELTKRFFTNKFNIYKGYYQELINDYDNKIDYLDGFVSSENVSYNEETESENSSTGSSSNNVSNIDLPNKVTQEEYITDKTNSTGSSNAHNEYVEDKTGGKIITRTGDVNILDQKIKYQKYLRNIYLEFVERFKDCFTLIYN